MIAIDHVIILVPDLGWGANQLLDGFGIASVNGGKHAGHGTGNRVVPLGATYLELMAVVDPTEAAGSPLGRWVTANTTADLMPAALCLRTDDISFIGRVLGEEPAAMSRQRPDGSVLSWRLAGLVGMLGPNNLPFFIEWNCPPEEHPAATPIEHGTEVTEITRVTIGRAGALEPVIADVDGLRIGAGVGVIETVIGTQGRPIILG